MRLVLRETPSFPLAPTATIAQSNPRDPSRKSASPHERSRRGRSFFRKTRPNHTVPRGIKGDGARHQQRTRSLYSLSPPAPSPFLFESQKFPSEEPAAGWAGWAQRGRFHRSICQLVLLPHSCQITQPIPSRPSHFSSRFFLPLLSRPLYVSVPRRAACFPLLFLSSSHSLFLALSFLLALSSLFLWRRGSLLYAPRPDSRFVFESTSCRARMKEEEKGGRKKGKRDMSVCECRVISVASTRAARICPGLVSQSTKDLRQTAGRRVRVRLYTYALQMYA